MFGQPVHIFESQRGHRQDDVVFRTRNHILALLKLRKGHVDGPVGRLVDHAIVHKFLGDGLGVKVDGADRDDPVKPIQRVFQRRVDVQAQVGERKPGGKRPRTGHENEQDAGGNEPPGDGATALFGPGNLLAYAVVFVLYLFKRAAFRQKDGLRAANFHHNGFQASSPFPMAFRYRDRPG